MSALIAAPVLAGAVVGHLPILRTPDAKRRLSRSGNRPAAARTGVDAELARTAQELAALREWTTPAGLVCCS